MFEILFVTVLLLQFRKSHQPEAIALFYSVHDGIFIISEIIINCNKHTTLSLQLRLRNCFFFNLTVCFFALFCFLRSVLIMRACVRLLRVGNRAIRSGDVLSINARHCFQIYFKFCTVVGTFVRLDVSACLCSCLSVSCLCACRYVWPCVSIKNNSFIELILLLNMFDFESVCAFFACLFVITLTSAVAFKTATILFFVFFFRVFRLLRGVNNSSTVVMSVCLFICLSMCPSVSLCAYLCVYVPVNEMKVH